MSRTGCSSPEVTDASTGLVMEPVDAALTRPLGITSGLAETTGCGGRCGFYSCDERNETG